MKLKRPKEKLFYIVTCSCNKYEPLEEDDLTCKSCGREPNIKTFKKEKEAEDYFNNLTNSKGAIMFESE